MVQAVTKGQQAPKIPKTSMWRSPSFFQGVRVAVFWLIVGGIFLGGFFLQPAPRSLTLIVLFALMGGYMTWAHGMEKLAGKNPADSVAQTPAVLFGAVFPTIVFLIGLLSIWWGGPSSTYSPQRTSLAAPSQTQILQESLGITPQQLASIQARQLQEVLKHGWKVSSPTSVRRFYDPRGKKQQVLFFADGLQEWRVSASLPGADAEGLHEFGLYGTAQDASLSENWKTFYNVSAGIIDTRDNMLYAEYRGKRTLGELQEIHVKLSPPPDNAPLQVIMAENFGPQGQGISSVVTLGKLWDYPPELTGHRLVMSVHLMATKPGGEPLPIETFANVPSTLSVGSTLYDWVGPTYKYDLYVPANQHEQNPEIKISCSVPVWLFANVIVRDIQAIAP